MNNSSIQFASLTKFVWNTNRVERNPKLSNGLKKISKNVHFIHVGCKKMRRISFISSVWSYSSWRVWLLELASMQVLSFPARWPVERERQLERRVELGGTFDAIPSSGRSPDRWRLLSPPAAGNRPHVKSGRPVECRTAAESPDQSIWLFAWKEIW
jgi:hypothetical protein